MRKEALMQHIVALSGGKDSTAMALRLAEVEPREYTYVCTPTGDEPEALFAHWRALSARLGKPILPLMHPLGLNGLIAKQRALPNYRQRWCTRLLKIEPYRAWLALQAPAVSHVGLRADEEGRAGGVYDDMAGITMRFPLREWGWTLDDVWTYLDQQRVHIPRRTDCQRCFFQTLYEWWLLWRFSPDIYAEAEAQEAMTGHTFRSTKRDTWPASLAELRVQFAQGYIPKQRDAALQALQCRMCTL
jgi:hypothetical protein